MTVQPHLSTDQLLQAARSEARPKVARRIQVHVTSLSLASIRSRYSAIKTRGGTMM